MTLGDIIKEYLEEHTVNEFLRDSGISKAYTYNLINNKGTNGAAPTPTIDTINKVARGIHSDFDTVFSKLDQDLILSTQSRPHVPVNRNGEGERTRMSAHFFFGEKDDGIIQIRLKDPYRSYLSVLSDETYTALLDAAKDCTPAQIQVAIDMLKAFKGEQQT